MALLLVARLAVPSRTNKLYGEAIDATGRAYRYKSPSAKHYTAWAHCVLQAQRPQEPWRVWQDGPTIAETRARKHALQVTTAFYFKTASSDIDGPLKTLLDMLQAYLGINDNRVYSAPLLKFVDPHFERVEFRVESITKPAYVSLWDASFAQASCSSQVEPWDMTTPDLPVVALS